MNVGGLRIFRIFELPLLAKELIEQAARRRTYIMRVIYAGLLYVFLIGPQLNFFRGNSNPLNLLGHGRELWEALLALQLGGIALFLPALMAGRITQEKERDSLTLLLLTDLSPTQIIVQKYLAGLIPMLTFLLLGLPLAGVAYSFGGFGAREVWWGAMVIGFFCLQVGALALWCSALFRNTVGAFLGTYFIGLAFYWTPLLLVVILNEAGIRWHSLEAYVYVHFPVSMLYAVRPGQGLPSQLWVMLAANTASIFLFLGLAIYHLPRRAFAAPKRKMKRLFDWFDQVFRRTNHWVGNIFIIRKVESLPESDPVSWRVRHKSVLGNPAHLIRILLLIEIPTVFLCPLLINHRPWTTDQPGLSALAAIEGTLFVLIIAVTASNAFVAERVNQTIEVLLTTPLSAREIVRQKARALRGLLIVAAVVLLTIFGLEAYFEAIEPTTFRAQLFDRSNRSVTDWMNAALFLIFFGPLLCLLYVRMRTQCRTQREAVRRTLSLLGIVIALVTFTFLIAGGALDQLTRKEHDLLLYLTNVGLTLGIYLPLVCWLALWIGLKTRTRAQAIFVTLAVIIGWCALPYLIFGGLMDFNRFEDGGALFLASPLTLPALNEIPTWSSFSRCSPWALVVVNFSFYGAILYFIRDACLQNADDYLRR